jgi:hypothetical protein
VSLIIEEQARSLAPLCVEVIRDNNNVLVGRGGTILYMLQLHYSLGGNYKCLVSFRLLLLVM